MSNSDYSRELGHATGHKDRLNRSSLYNYSNERGYEEAVAEIHAMLVCRSFGVNSLPEHANYVKGWLGEDKNAYKLKKAAFEAYKAFEYTMEKSIRNINAMYYPLCQLYLRPVARVSNGYFSGISEVVVIKIDAI
ncbi:zincin-like metallopeptidase domain-containing protein [Marinobacter alkaliphilus]|uniref:Zincin-like metallopeptidase domain-containing protein n=1 Tax=Marinobacter alkaliphilus TaxID=254719 RepID=A0ABZ3EAH1_9GAMM